MYCWLIAAITAVLHPPPSVSTCLWLPVYKADGLLQVEEKSGGGIHKLIKSKNIFFNLSFFCHVASYAIRFFSSYFGG